MCLLLLSPVLSRRLYCRQYRALERCFPISAAWCLTYRSTISLSIEFCVCDLNSVNDCLPQILIELESTADSDTSNVPAHISANLLSILHHIAMVVMVLL